ncbi:MAG TPA: hypothetical protein VIS06_12660 [Mycobacteriales bacterium]|jgi:hypothetical protein
MAGLSPFEVAARRFERRADPSVDLELWNMIRAAKGLPAQTLAEAEADVRACIDSGQYAQALTRLEQG